ncbi:MAG: type I glutamate--ammonia ligase [Calditrichaceae bacterium]
MTRQEILKSVKENDVAFLRLQFTDIMGSNKNVEVPRSQFEKALDGEIMFDGSSIEGFARIEESDQLLQPDLDTFVILPWDNGKGKVARMICDIYSTDHEPFPGDPRYILKRAIAEAEQMGFTMVAGPEPEFFLFQKNSNGIASTVTHDSAGYFDLAPIDLGEDARRDMINILMKLGFEIEAAHHEVAHGQHEIDFRYEEALKTADNISTFRWVVRRVAFDHGLHATFMPKPVFGINGSGMHVHQSLFKGDTNIFYDPKAKYQLSQIAMQYIGGILKHARNFSAITNPTVNSYKRLVPGYEAPVNVAWSEKNRSPLVRVPAKRGKSTRIELRMPDPACNPYLALAVMLKSGIDGIKNNIMAKEPVNKNIFTMSIREKQRLQIKELPANLLEAVELMEKDAIIKEALGDHIFNHFVAAKKAEWQEYITQVHQWEVDRYLSYY